MYNKKAFHKHCNPHHSLDMRNFGEHFKGRERKGNFRSGFVNPPANVREMDEKYELHLFAPGYEKSDFIIAIIDMNISISVKKENLELGDSWKRQEYIPKGFDRQFELNEKIDKSNIQAKYENGVLVLSLPKLEGFETSREEIMVD